MIVGLHWVVLSQARKPDEILTVVADNDTSPLEETIDPLPWLRSLESREQQSRQCGDATAIERVRCPRGLLKSSTPNIAQPRTQSATGFASSFARTWSPSLGLDNTLTITMTHSLRMLRGLKRQRDTVVFLM